jgi:hypothetical protein
MRRRPFLVAVLVLIAAVTAVEFIPLYLLIWDGGYELTVHVDTPADPPTAVACSAFGRREDAEHLCELSREAPAAALFAEGGRATLADPFHGQPLKVYIWVSGRESAFGREVSRSQQRFLVVGAEWPDGRRVCKVVEIPDGRVSREMRVTVP